MEREAMCRRAVLMPVAEPWPAYTPTVEGEQYLNDKYEDDHPLLNTTVVGQIHIAIDVRACLTGE